MSQIELKYFDDEAVGSGFALVELDDYGQVCSALGPYDLESIIGIGRMIDCAVGDVGRVFEGQDLRPDGD